MKHYQRAVFNNILPQQAESAKQLESTYYENKVKEFDALLPLKKKKSHVCY